MAPPIGPTITWSKPWCFALALAAEHQMPKDGDSTTTKWEAVTIILNEVFKTDATFARDFPSGTKKTKFQTQWSERDRGTTSKWRFADGECSPAEAAGMNAIRNIVFATEHRLSAQPGSEVQAPGPNAIRWPVYHPKDREARLAAQKASTLKARLAASRTTQTQPVSTVSTTQPRPNVGRPRKRKREEEGSREEEDDTTASPSNERAPAMSINNLLNPAQPAVPEIPRRYMGDGILDDQPAVERFSWEAFQRENIIILHDRDTSDWHTVKRALLRTPGFVPEGRPNMTNLTLELGEPLCQSTGRNLEEVKRATHWATDVEYPSPWNFLKIALAPTLNSADKGYETQTTSFDAIIHEIQVLNGGGLAMVHSKDVDFSSGMPICVTRSHNQSHPSQQGAPPTLNITNETANQIQLVPARSETRLWGGEVRRVLFQDNITGQNQEVDIMLCDKGICSICGPGEHPGRRSDLKNNFHALPLVHRKDIVTLEDGVSAFAPIDQIPVGKPPRVMNGDICKIVFNGEFDIMVDGERKMTKAILCDFFEHEDPDDKKCLPCMAFTVTMREAFDKEQARLAEEGLVQEGLAEEGLAEDGMVDERLAGEDPAEEDAAGEGFAGRSLADGSLAEQDWTESGVPPT